MRDAYTKRPNRAVCGRKHCLRCGRWRPLCDFPAHRREPKLEVLSRCYACRRADNRERLADPGNRARKREWHREYQRRRRRRMGQLTRERWAELNKAVICGRRHCTRCGCWRPVSDFMLHPEGRLTGRCRACLRAAAKETYARASADPERLELRREYQRIWAEARRRAQGVPERQWIHGRPMEGINPRWTLDDPSALRAQVRAWLIETHGTEEQLAELAGVSERLIGRLLNEDAKVTVWAADRLAMALGLHLELVA